MVDTRGINVWCAGGKGTFSAEEIAYQVKKANLHKIVDHRNLILPQLCANGVALHKLKPLCGFRGQFGPIKATDLVKFLQTGCASEEVRSVTFDIKERAVLIPLEICMLWKQFLLITLFFFILSGISKDYFSLDLALQRGTTLTLATLLGVFSGAVITALLLPWIPARPFWIKGAITGGVVTLFYSIVKPATLSTLDFISLIFWVVCCSSYLAMNFTGSTVYTSLSGVEKEMRTGLVFQTALAIFVIVLWLVSAFI